MVRKVDELGRVVIPKEMRRILNIKTGSSIEMSINSDNQVVLKKFSELANIISMAEALLSVIFDTFDIPCFLCDDERVLCVKGLSKKDYLDKRVCIQELDHNSGEITKLSNIICELRNDDNCTPFKVSSEGYEVGFLILVHNNKIDCGVKNSIELLLKLFSNLSNF